MMMVEWIKDLPVLMKCISSFIGGLVAAIGFLLGLVWGPLRDHDERITVLEDGSRVVVCWVHSQISGTDPTLCLFPQSTPWSRGSGGGNGEAH
jgi:hypothetical protein